MQEGQELKAHKTSSCRQEGHTHGLQCIRDLGSGQSEITCSAKLDLDLSEDLEFYFCSNSVTSIKFLYKSGLKRQLQLLTSSAFSCFSLYPLVLGCNSLLGFDIGRGQASQLKMMTYGTGLVFMQWLLRSPGYQEASRQKVSDFFKVLMLVITSI